MSLTDNRGGYAIESRCDEPVPEDLQLTRYTCFITDAGGGWVAEEIDVDATSIGIAKKLVQQILDEHYMDGLRIRNIEERWGMYT